MLKATFHNPWTLYEVTLYFFLITKVSLIFIFIYTDVSVYDLLPLLAV